MRVPATFRSYALVAASSVTSVSLENLLAFLSSFNNRELADESIKECVVRARCVPTTDDSAAGRDTHSVGFDENIVTYISSVRGMRYWLLADDSNSKRVSKSAYSRSLEHNASE